jgi:hypothetical protein
MLLPPWKKVRTKIGKIPLAQTLSLRWRAAVGITPHGY